jgi:ferritin
MEDHAEEERQRQARMAEHVQSTGADAIYEVVDDVSP